MNSATSSNLSSVGKPELHRTIVAGTVLPSVQLCVHDFWGENLVLPSVQCFHLCFHLSSCFHRTIVAGTADTMWEWDAEDNDAENNE